MILRVIRYAYGRGRTASRGQTMVEFAFVFPLVLAMIVAMITGAFLFFQNQALNNATRAAARWASIESAPSAGACETGNPTDSAGKKQTAVTKAQQGAGLVPVNPAQLCPANGSTTEMTQGGYYLNKANIVLDASPSLLQPECVTVSIVYQPPSLPGPWGTIVMRAQSSAPTFAAKSTSTCPDPTWADGRTIITSTVTSTSALPATTTMAASSTATTTRLSTVTNSTVFGTTITNTVNGTKRRTTSTLTQYSTSTNTSAGTVTSPYTTTVTNSSLSTGTVTSRRTTTTVVQTATTTSNSTTGSDCQHNPSGCSP